MLCDREDGQDAGDHRRAGLRDDEQAPAVGAIRDDAAEEPERDPRDRASQPDEAEVEGREVRGAVADSELHDEPAQPVDLHPRADVRDDEAEPEEAEVAVLEGREHRGAAGLVSACFVQTLGLELRGDALLCSAHHQSVPAWGTSTR